MATLSSSARLKLKCKNPLCGKKFDQDPAALIRLGRAAEYCCDPCLVEGAPELVCDACGDSTDPDRPGLYDRLLDGMRLPVCQNCQYIAFRSCWRKRCFPSETLAAAWAEVFWTAGRIRGTRQIPCRQNPYLCLICDRYHTTSGRGRLDDGPYKERLLMISAVFIDIGFGVDDLRGWTIYPDGSRGLPNADDFQDHTGVQAAQRVLAQARMEAERC